MAARFRLEGTLLQTRVARRILGLFLLCALLPVTLLGIAAYANVAETLREQALDRVQATSKRLGLALHDRLETLASALDAVAGGSTSPAADLPFDGLAIAGAAGEPRLLSGTLANPPALTAKQQEHLARGATIVTVGADRGQPVILLARTVGGRPGPGVLWARPAEDVIARSLTGVEETEFRAQTCVVHADGRPVYCPDGASALAEGALAPAVGEVAAGTFEWAASDRYLAGFWSLFLDYRFASPDWRIIYSEPEAQILAPLSRFNRTFPLVALLSFLVVGLLSHVQIRRSLRPLAALREGTERLARREFDQAVDIKSGDEFEELAGAFNDMARSLEERLAEAERLNRALRQASDELGEREARLRAILESAADAVLTVDEAGRIESFNRTAERAFGYPREEVAGRPLADFFAVSPGTGPGGLPVTKDFLGSPTLQIAARRRDGATFPTELAVSEAQASGRRISTLFVRDITERKRSEEQRELLEAQLRHAQKLETIGTLAGGIAHDFNNILTPILGHVDLALADLPEGSELRPDLEQVREAARRAKDLVQQILLFSRRAEQRLGMVELGPVVKEALKLLRASLPTTIEIRSAVEPTLAPVLGDPTQLHQVLMNLCTNAYHAMRDTGGVLDVRLELAPVPAHLAAMHPRLDAERAVRLTVSDTGHGMDAATLERLYEPFFTTKPAGEGTGLGMSIVHGIVASHGGAITVESAPGKGTRFDIHLPPAARAAPAEAAAGRQPLRRGRGHVLVVDDEDVITRLVSRILERAGYKVTGTTSPLEALRLVRDQPQGFDLVITDQTMPGMTGTQLAEQLRRVKQDLPIILMTGYSEIATRETVDEMGLRDILIKPVEIEVLAAAVARALTPEAEGAADAER